MLTQMTSKQRSKLEATFKEMVKKAQEDPVYFFSTFLYTFNPKQKPFHFRFIPFPFQKRLIRTIIEHIQNGEDLYVEKCREMGATYTLLGVFIWLWLWTPASNFLIGSRKEEYVDNRRGGTVGNKEESLFGKIDYMMSRLPKFILPPGYNSDKHFNYMSLVNPNNGNSISGESSNENFSRGGRKKAIMLDEFAFWQNSTAAWGSTADTTNCRIILTTPGIKPGKAKRLRFGKDGEKIKIVTLPYNLDPRKNKVWLADQKSRRSEEDFNREIMINWEMSLKGRIYPEMKKAVYGDFPLIPGVQIFVSGDYGLDGTTFLFWQRNPKNGKWRLINSFHHEDEPIEYYFPLFGNPVNSKFSYTNQQLSDFEFISAYPPAIHFGDPSIVKRSGNEDKKSDRDKLAAIGVYVLVNTKNNSIEYRVNTTKVALKNGIEINENENNNYAFEVFKGYRWKTWDEDHETTSGFRKPIHNFCSHPSTAMEFMFVNVEKYIMEKQEAPAWATKVRGWLTSKKSIKKR